MHRALLWAAVAVGGCGGGSGGSVDLAATDLASAPDLATPADAATPIDQTVLQDLAGACTALANGASGVMQIQVATDPPPATGGNLTDGTYYLTALTLYTGSGGMTGPNGLNTRFTSRVTAGSYESVAVTTPMVSEARTSGTLSLNGTTLTVAQSCPMASTTPFGLSFDGSIAILYAPPQNGVTTAYTFTKQ